MMPNRKNACRNDGRKFENLMISFEETRPHLAHKVSAPEKTFVFSQQRRQATPSAEFSTELLHA
jgi:hypothetical protein